MRHVRKVILQWGELLQKTDEWIHPPFVSENLLVDILALAPVKTKPKWLLLPSPPAYSLSCPFSLGRLEAPWSRKPLRLLCSPAKFCISRWCQPCTEQIKEENKQKTATQERQRIAMEAEKEKEKKMGAKEGTVKASRKQSCCSK